MASAFFYGTLMHPKILQRVVGHNGSYLQIRPALLLDYTRHKVKGADYPGIVPYAQSKEMFSRDLDLEEICVRGSVVTGLSDEDIRLLDIFEGDEYTREQVLVHPLGPLTSLDDVEAKGVVETNAPPAPPRDGLTSALPVQTYVWLQPSRLEPKLWTLEEFVQESAWKWIGPGSDARQHYFTEVERRQAMNGVITSG